MKQAFYADFIYYDLMLHTKSWLLVSGNTIEGIANNAPDGYEQTKFCNSAIFPGLINTHTHLGMSAFRGMADDLPLMEWLTGHIWPAEKKYVSPEFVYQSTLLSLGESIRSGVTCINDMYFHADAAAAAVRDSYLRGVVGMPVLGDVHQAFKLADSFKECEQVKLAICPHALYTAGVEKIKLCTEFASNRNMLLHTHLAETLDEAKTVMEKYGDSPVKVMDKTGAFDHKKSIFAHCVHLSPDDIKLMGEKHVCVSHCLESNLKLASGFAPIKKLMDAGAWVSIGTDGAASNNDQSMIGEMSTVSKFHKALNMDATVLSAKTVLDMATKNAAESLGFDKIGVLKKGFFADFFVLSFDDSRMTPVYDPISHLVYAAQNNDVTHVFSGGKVVMENRHITAFDEEKAKQNITKYRNLK